MLQDFIDPLIGVQDLLSMAFDRFVVAQGGRARVEGCKPTYEQSHLWNDSLMEVPPTAVGPSRQLDTDTQPLFTLTDVGGRRRYPALARASQRLSRCCGSDNLRVSSRADHTCVAFARDRRSH